MFPRTRWVTFDCYGTLIDWQTGFARTLAGVAGDHAGDLMLAYHAFERDVAREQPHKPYKDVLVLALARAAAACGVRLSDAGVRALPEAWASLRPFDDVEALLAELRMRGYKLAVLTNCDDDLFEATHRAFRRPFDFVLTAERVRGYKPAPWHFRAFELVTRARRADWVHVACSWYHDIAPAETFGVKRVWLDRDRTGEAPPPDTAHVHTAEDAVEAIEACWG